MNSVKYIHLLKDVLIRDFDEGKRLQYGETPWHRLRATQQSLVDLGVKELEDGPLITLI